MKDRFATGQSNTARPSGLYLGGGPAAAPRPWPSGVATLAIMAALMALTTASPAEAATKEAPRPRVVEAAAPRDAGEPVMGIVSIKSQQVTFYDADGWIL